MVRAPPWRKTKKTLCNSNWGTRLHNSFLDPKGVKICMTQSFKLNCSVSEDKDNCGEKSRRKCSKRNNNGASGPFITHRLWYKTAPALQNFRLWVRTSTVASWISDVTTAEPNQRGYNTGAKCFQDCLRLKINTNLQRDWAGYTLGVVLSSSVLAAFSWLLCQVGCCYRNGERFLKKSPGCPSIHSLSSKDTKYNVPPMLLPKRSIVAWCKGCSRVLIG